MLLGYCYYWRCLFATYGINSHVIDVQHHPVLDAAVP